MNYKEFRDTCSWMLKMYPDTDLIYADDMDEIIGKCICTNYIKSGSRWKEIGKGTKEMSRQFYMNCVDAIPFFRRLGGIERVSKGYTYIGYIPTEISSINPDKTKKTKREFIIER